MGDIHNELLPEQQSGTQKDFSNEVECRNQQEAIELYETARHRLVDVNRWDSLCRGVSANFCLIDSEGEALEGLANTGDYIRIDIPGPGTAEGQGYDWVRIESIESTNPEPGHEVLMVTVRPSANPVSPGNETAHFFDESATSSFAVEREDKRVKAFVHGRNEKPNTGNERLLDKARNLLVGKGAIAGMANLQWKSLVHGLLRH